MAQMQQGVVDIKIIFLPLSGFLFLFPGFISDVMALLLLIPFVQNKCSKVYSSKSGSGTTFAFKNANSEGFSDVFHKGQGRTIEGTATVVDNEAESISDKDDASKKDNDSTKQI